MISLRKLVELLLLSPVASFVVCIAYLEQFMSEMLLWLGKPTPSQCAALELSTRLDAALERESIQTREIDALRDQLSKVIADKQKLEQQIQQERASVEESIACAKRSAAHGPGWALHASMLLLGAALVPHAPLMKHVLEHNTVQGSLLAGSTVLTAVWLIRRNSWLSVGYGTLTLSAFLMAGCMIADWVQARFPNASPLQSL